MYRMFTRNLSVSAALQQKMIRTPVPVYGIEGRYVQALYSAASQQNQLDQVEKCLLDFQKVLTKPVVVDFIATSMISRAGKAKLLKEIAESAGAPSCATNFFAVVAENGRLKMLRKIIVMFKTVMAAHRKEAECEVITATPLESSEREALITVLKKFVKAEKKITLTERVDPDVIGGLVVVIEDKHVDLCIYRKILLYTQLLQRSV